MEFGENIPSKKQFAQKPDKWLLMGRQLAHIDSYYKKFSNDWKYREDVPEHTSVWRDLFYDSGFEKLWSEDNRKSIIE